MQQASQTEEASGAMSLHAARGGAHEDPSWSALGRRAAPRDVIVGDRGGGVGMRRALQQGGGGGPAGAVRVDEASSASTFRELDDAFLQKQTKIWLGEVLHLRFDEDILVADLLADGELLFQVSKVLWKRLLKKNREQLKQSKVYICERLSFGRSNGKYMPYSKVDSFLKICQILGLAGIDLFTPSDVVEKRNVRKVCICIRSVSKKSHMMCLNVPDFDIVTYTISMPNYIVGGICRSLEQPQYSSSSSSGYSPHESSKALQQQIIFDGQNGEHGDTNYDSDEAESRLSVLEPEDSVDEDNFAAVLSQLSNAPKEESEGYGESGHGMHEEKSLAESVESLNFGVVDSESVDSTPQKHDKESYSTHSATDQCSRTRTAKCSLSSEESDSISSHLAFESDKDDPELNAHPVEDSVRIYDGHVKSLDHSIQGTGETFADHPNKENADIQKDTGTMNLHCDALACDRESVCSSCEESRYGLNREPSDSSSESNSGLNPIHTMSGKLPMVSDDPVNNIEPSMTGMTNDSTSEELNPEFRDTNQMMPPETHKTSLSLDHSIQGNGGTLADHPKKVSADIQKDTGTMNLHCDTLACDKESVCSSCKESRYGLNGEPSDSSSESHSGLKSTHTTCGKLPMFSEEPVNSIEPSMSAMTNGRTNEELSPEFRDTNQMMPRETHKISLSPQLPMFSEDPVDDIEPSMTGMTNDSTSEELNPEFSSTNQMEGSQSVDKPVESQDTAQDIIAPQRPEDDPPKSGKGVLKSVAGGITLVSAVFFMVHLRRSKERSFTRIVPSLSEKSIQSESRRAKNMDNGKVSDVYPGARLKV